MLPELEALGQEVLDLHHQAGVKEHHCGSFPPGGIMGYDLVRSRARRSLVAALTVLAMFGSPWGVLEAEAGGFHISTIGGTRTSMTTNIARPDDTTALLHNPAGLADQKSVRLHLSASVPFMELEFRLKELDPERFPAINPDGCEKQTGGCPWPVSADGYYEQPISPNSTFGLVPFLGASTDLSFLSSARRDMVVALGVYAPNFFGAFLPDNAPTAYFMIDGMFLVISTSVGWAWRINRMVAVGASLSYNNMQLQLSQKISTVDALTPSGQTPSTLARAGQGMLGDLMMTFEGVDHGASWGAGVLFQPVDMLTFGLTYFGSTTANFRGDVSIKALGLKDQGAMENLLRIVDYKLPEQLIIEIPIPHSMGAGVLLRLAPWITLGFDCRIWLYNLIEKQSIIPIYNPDTPGKEPMTEESMTKVKYYNLSYQLSGGISLTPFARWPELELMAGFIYDASPVPDATYSLDNPSMNYVSPAMGVRFLLAGHWRITLSYMVLFYLERDITNSVTSPPTNVVGSGINHFPGVELEYIF